MAGGIAADTACRVDPQRSPHGRRVGASSLRYSEKSPRPIFNTSDLLIVLDATFLLEQATDVSSKVVGKDVITMD
jgi:hypothetical protein